MFLSNEDVSLLGLLRDFKRYAYNGFSERDFESRQRKRIMSDLSAQRTAER